MPPAQTWHTCQTRSQVRYGSRLFSTLFSYACAGAETASMSPTLKHVQSMMWKHMMIGSFCDLQFRSVFPQACTSMNACDGS
jgi:hypothetical protein